MVRKTTSTTKATPRKKTSTARKEAPGASAKPQKPMFRAGTWITLILLAALIGITVYLNRKKENTAEATPTSEEITYVFAATEGTASSIEIKPADGDAQRVRIARNEQNVWAIELPLEAEANQGLAEAAATQISALKVVSPIDGKLDIFGLDHPAYIITIKFSGDKQHTLEIGDSTPTNSGYYVRVDKDKMMITDLSGIDSLLQLVNFPPYLNTLTPTPTLTSTPLPVTETPVPSTESTTPEATVTPTP